MSQTAQAISSSSSITRRQAVSYGALCLIWGSTWLAIRAVVRYVPPFEAAGIRFLVAGTVLLGLAVVQKRKWPEGKRQWNAIVVLSFTMMAIPYGLLFWAEQYVASSLAAILYAASPLAVSVLTPIFIHEKVPRGAVLAMVVAFGGIVALFYQELSATRAEFMGGGAVVLAMAASAWSTVYAKKRLQEIDSVIATGLQFLFGSVALFWGTWAFESRRHAEWNFTAIANLMFLTVVGSCIVFVVYYWLLKTMRPYQISTVSLVVPVVAVLEGAFLGHEPVPWISVGVIAVVLIAVGSALRAEALGEGEVDILMLRDKT
jgi:drug/metabolite transporter (DMT)-like permease